VDSIFCSPLSRAVDTASLVFGEDAKIITDSSLQEFHFGEWEGMHFSEIAKQYPDIHLGPGYQYDQGVNKWTLGFSVVTA
jgi:broad specificity phosphatase PhoE